METYDRKIRSLPEVMRCLELCYRDECENCDYCGHGCSEMLGMDALFWLKELRSENESLHWNLKNARDDLNRIREKLPQGRTNYARIKNMTPLRLTEWVMKVLAPCECCDKQGVCGIPEDEVNDEYCAEHILAWLMQEAENE